MKCEFCSGETKLKKVRKQHWFQRKLFVVDNVEAEVCSDYGERYYHASVLDKIAQIFEFRA